MQFCDKTGYIWDLGHLGYRGLPVPESRTLNHPDQDYDDEDEDDDAMS